MISIITINYNNANGLEATLQSVQQQTFTQYEHIVIDGGSTDGSKEVIEKHRQALAYWVSEKDAGVYAAMNKGIKVAKGSYLQFLNSGDVLKDATVLEGVSRALEGGLDLYYGDLLFEGNGKSIHQTYPDELTFTYFTQRSLGHPATFIKKSLFDRVFYYNEHLKICSDWEFFMCAVCKYNASYKHLDKVIAIFDTAGMSSQESYQTLIKEEQAEVLQRDFSFFLNEHKQLEVLERKCKSVPYKTLDLLLQGRVSKKVTLGMLRVLNSIFR